MDLLDAHGVTNQVLVTSTALERNQTELLLVRTDLSYSSFLTVTILSPS